MAIIITSTTGTAADINAAAEMYEGDELVQPAAETPLDKQHDDDHEQGHEATIARTPSVAAFDSSKSAEEVQRDTEAVQADLDEQREERKEEYLDSPRVGKTRAKLLRRLSRMHGENEELRSELERYRSGQPPPVEQQQAASQNGDAQTARTPPAEQQQQQFPPPWQQQQQADQQFFAEFQAKQARLPELAKQARERIPELEQKLQRLDKENPVSQVTALHVSTLDNPFDVGVYLADHPQVIAKLWSLEGTGQGPKAIELLNRISQNLQDGIARTSTHNRPRPQSAAPPPIRPVGGGSGGASAGSAGDPARMSYADYKTWHDQKFGKR